MPDQKDHILDEIKRVANQLGKDSITAKEFYWNSNVRESTVRYNFGSWNRAVALTDLKPMSGNFGGAQREAIPDQELLDEIVRLSKELGKSPSESEMNAFGRFSTRPYRKRWGTFSKAKALVFLESAGQSAELPRDQILQNKVQAKRQHISETSHGRVAPSTARNRVKFGAPIDFRGVRHAPLNEQGVVYLFGMVSRELGFLIESIRTGFPDCEGKRCVDSKKGHWEQVQIEFEYKSSNFLEHGH